MKPFAHTLLGLSYAKLSLFLWVISLSVHSLLAEDFEKLTGKELIRQLKDEKTRLPVLRNYLKAKKKESEANVRRPEWIVCPQEKGGAPVYIILYEFLSTDDFSDTYKIKNSDQLFAQDKEKAKKSLQKRDHLAFVVFTHDGKEITPYGGNNCLNEGVFEDINGDSLIERADHTSYGLDWKDKKKERMSIDVLEISVVSEKPQPLLNVLYNWGEDDWDYQFVDRDKDGIAEIELGPPSDAKIIDPQVIFTWDKIKKTYGSSAGEKGEHFVVLSKGDIWAELKRLQTSQPEFPKEKKPVASTETRRAFGPPLKATPVESVSSKPYEYRSLKEATDEEIIHYMGEGKPPAKSTEWAETAVPKPFWSLPSKEAALAMANENRSSEHKQKYEIAIDDREQATPPEAASIIYSYSSARCYTAVDDFYFLRVDPKKSYLAFARGSDLGVVFYDPVHAGPRYDFRYAEISYQDARQIAQTIWWLNRVRTRKTFEDSSSGGVFSTGDGNGGLLLMDAQGKAVLQISDRVWSGSVISCWANNYNERVCLNLAEHLITRVLPKRVPDQWSPPKIKSIPGKFFQKGVAPESEEEQWGEIQKQMETFLSLFSLDQRFLSHSILKQVVLAAGNSGTVEFLPKLRDMESVLSKTRPISRSAKVIEKELKEADAREDLHKWYALHKELKEVEQGVNLESATIELKIAVQDAISKITIAKNPDALLMMSKSKSKNGEWAFQRLKTLDPKLYVQALEWWLDHTDGKRKQQIFEEIVNMAPERAEEIAPKLPKDQREALLISVLGSRQKNGKILDENKHVDALLKIVTNPKEKWDDRSHAMEFLVPEEDPLRFKSSKIDEALIQILKDRLEKASLKKEDLLSEGALDNSFVARRAIDALSSRGNLDAFVPMKKLWESEALDTDKTSNLTSLLRLAHKGGKAYTQQLLPALKANLKHTNFNLMEVIMDVWVVDLRELEPDLKRIATASPDDEEGFRVRQWGGAASDVNEKYHLARKVLSLWKEEDRLTRAKLIIAFGMLSNRLDSSFELERAKSELQKIQSALSESEKKEVQSFLDFCGKQSIQPHEIESQTRFAKCVRELFGWNE
jgi:hypothetical protein